jgi:hypothetical protein
MSRKAAGNYLGCRYNIPESREIVAHNSCKTLHAWKAHSTSLGKATPEHEVMTITTFNINKILTAVYAAIRTALAHCLQYKCPNQNGHHKGESGKFGGFGVADFFSGQSDVLREQAKQPLRCGKDALPRRDIPKGMRGQECPLSVRIWTGERCGAGSSGKAL